MKNYNLAGGTSPGTFTKEEPPRAGGALSTCTYREANPIFLGQIIAYPGCQTLSKRKMNILSKVIFLGLNETDFIHDILWH